MIGYFIQELPVLASKKGLYSNKSGFSIINFVHNKVIIGDTKFDVNYVKLSNVNHYSIEVTFPFNGKVYSWAPRPPRFDPNTGKYYLNFHGEYHHTPISSSKNILLQNR